MSALPRRIAEPDPSDADTLSALFGYLRTNGGHVDLGELVIYYDPEHLVDFTERAGVLYDEKTGAWIVQKGFREKRAYSTGHEALMVALRELKVLL